MDGEKNTVAMTGGAQADAAPEDDTFESDTAPADAIHQALDKAHADIARLEVENRALAAKLAAIESSTSWRVMLRLHPLVWALKAVVRWLRELRTRLVHHNPIARRKSEADMRETCLIPTWNNGAGTWRLELDRARLEELRRTQAAPARSIPSYVVTPAVPVDPDAKRPLVMHVIANVHVGGSTQLIIDLLEHLADRFEQEVVTSALWHAGAHRGMTTHVFRAPLNVGALRKLLEEKKPAIVHMHYWGLVDEHWYRAAMLAVTSVDCRIVENINTPIAPYIDPRIDHYIYVSEYVRETFGAGADAPATSSVIHPGINLSLFDRPIRPDETDNSIGMVYRLENDKLRPDSIQLFIEVVKRRPRTKVYIVGGGSLFRSYVAQTRAARVRQNFHFTGYVPYETLPGWYSRFAIFVAPVQKESFGQVSVFAMNMKMTVAGFKIGALPEILASTETLGDDIHATADKIVALLDDRERRRVLGEQNRARAQAAFGVKDMTMRYGAIYDRLLAT
jgi:glycosyltransferase involved in cell wall biosynthesis